MKSKKTTSTSTQLMLVLVTALLASAMNAATPTALSAQAAWGVTINLAPDPLPIGQCSQVWLAIKDATGKDTPRNPAGMRVTLADFDMSVTGATPTAAAGEYNGANNWSVCACPGAKVGSAATITAKYPASSLPAKSRVAGVALQATLPFKIAAAKGSANPPSCAALKKPTVVKPRTKAAP
jgi:hypothetical protein